MPITRPLDSVKGPRKIYPYSVIPGGAYSGEELALARRVDPVVAAHYSDFETGAVAVRSLPQDTYLYVSYRKADRVYWTANKHRIPKDEPVLSDGKHMARTRCGNRLSAVPQLPIAAGPQPTEAALGTPELPPGVELAPAPLFASQYDTPAMPLASARDRLFAFPTGITGASPLAQAFPPSTLPSPIMVVADGPFGGRGIPAATGGHGSGSLPSSSSGSGPVGSGPVGSGPGGSGPVGSGPGGPTPVGPAPGGPPSGGPIPAGNIPEPASAALLAAGAAVLLLGARRVCRKRSTAG